MVILCGHFETHDLKPKNWSPMVSFTLGKPDTTGHFFHTSLKCCKGIRQCSQGAALLLVPIGFFGRCKPWKKTTFGPVTHGKTHGSFKRNLAENPEKSGTPWFFFVLCNFDASVNFSMSKAARNLAKHEAQASSCPKVDDLNSS